MQMHKTSLVRRTSLGMRPVGDISIGTPEMVYLMNGETWVHNCPSNCSFCKESILARGYTQLQVDEKTGRVRVELEDREPFEVPSKTKVKFYDTGTGQIVYGPLSVAIVNEYPIATDSLQKLRSGELVRLLSD